MSDPRRQLLLQMYAAAGRACAQAPAARAAGSVPDEAGETAHGDTEHEVLAPIGSLAQGCGLPARRLDAVRRTSPARLAVHMSHSIELAGPGLTLWCGELEPCGADGPAQHLALAAARLLAGREQLLLLAAALCGTDAPSADAGALVDANTCARIAVAGLELELALAQARSNFALQLAGDLLAPLDRALDAAPSDGWPVPDDAAPAFYLVLGLKVTVAAAAAWEPARGRVRPRVL